MSKLATKKKCKRVELIRDVPTMLQALTDFDYECGQNKIFCDDANGDCLLCKAVWFMQEVVVE